MAQISGPAFADTLCFALALPGCPFGPAPCAMGTTLTVTRQEPQPVPTAPLQGVAPAHASGSDNLRIDPVSFPWLPWTPRCPRRGPSQRHFPA